MSATRDKSQNVGFVYTNIYQLYKKSQSEVGSHVNAARDELSLSSEQRVWRPENLGDIKITKFQPPMLARTITKTPADIKAPAAAPVAMAAAVSGNPFDDLKNNLHKLQDLHSKLRFMLTELEELVAKK